MSKASERVKLWRQRLKAEGKQPITLWLDREAVERLEALSSSLGVSHADAVARVLGSVTDTVTDTVADTLRREIAEALRHITDTITASVCEAVQQAMQPIAVTVTDTNRPAASAITVTHTHVTDTVTDTHEAVRAIMRRWREKAGHGPRWVHVCELLGELEQAVSAH